MIFFPIKCSFLSIFFGVCWIIIGYWSCCGCDKEDSEYCESEARREEWDYEMGLIEEKESEKQRYLEQVLSILILLKSFTKWLGFQGLERRELWNKHKESIKADDDVYTQSRMDIGDQMLELDDIKRAENMPMLIGLKG